MGESVKLIRGWMRNGVIVPEPGMEIPDGAELRMELVPAAEQGPIPFTPEEQAEYDGWERLGDEAWTMIDHWEEEDRANGTG